MNNKKDLIIKLGIPLALCFIGCLIAVFANSAGVGVSKSNTAYYIEDLEEEFSDIYTMDFEVLYVNEKGATTAYKEKYAGYFENTGTEDYYGMEIKDVIPLYGFEEQLMEPQYDNNKTGQIPGIVLFNNNDITNIIKLAGGYEVFVRKNINGITYKGSYTIIKENSDFVKIYGLLKNQNNDVFSSYEIKIENILYK